MTLTFNSERSARYEMAAGTWTFRVDDDCELFIYDPAGFRRRMAREKFGTPSEAMAAARAFVKEWLA